MIQTQCLICRAGPAKHMQICQDLASAHLMVCLNVMPSSQNALLSCLVVCIQVVCSLAIANKDSYRISSTQAHNATWTTANAAGGVLCRGEAASLVPLKSLAGGLSSCLSLLGNGGRQPMRQQTTITCAGSCICFIARRMSMEL